MNYAHSIKCMMIFLIIQSYTIYCHDTYPSQKTTKLIEFVKQQKDSLIDLQRDANQLMDKCVGEYYGRRSNPYSEGFYIKKWSASISDLKKLHDIRREITNPDIVMKERIADLIQQGESFDATDLHNHTALYYANSSRVYNALRSSGADFELAPALNAYKWYAIPVSAVFLCIVSKLCESKNFSFDGMFSTNEDIKKIVDDVHGLHIRDEQGRTPLMNYVIEQEQALVALRLKIDIAWNDDTEWDDYYAMIIHHKAVRHQTQINIEKMVELGAAVDVYDVHGKTLLDYCVTKEIYETLLAVGAPFQINAWAYFNYDSYVKQAPIIIPILTAALLAAVSMIKRKDMSFDDERNEWFDQWARRNF